jgi:P27 family predicted phage terminase small subunit
LAERKILTEADVGMIETYCMSIGTVRDMDREIQRTGAVQKVYKVDKDGNSFLVSVRKNPAVSIRNEAMTQARLVASELGATPVSRSRPTIADDDDDDDLFGWQGAS